MAMTLITTNTESGDASSSFTSGIDSTYKLYIFKLIDLNPATDNVHFTFQGSIDGGSNYNVASTTTLFQSYHNEDDSAATMSYVTSQDAAQSTSFLPLCHSQGNGGDESMAGTLWLFNPSNTTYVKHFYSTMNGYAASDYSNNNFVAGYFNDTNDIDAIQFKFSSGNMDGVIKMYGVG